MIQSVPDSTESRLWPAPAKLNLLLHITGRRQNGYHELQTVFQLLDYGDEIGLHVNSGGQVRRVAFESDVPVSGAVEPQNDLCVRAANLLQQRAPVDAGVDIRVRKKIPMGAGLGGGSSDAATTLVALNRLWQTNLPTAELAQLGGQLGADVPVFIQGYSAWAEGTGELITPLTLPERWYVVIWPGVAVPTAEIFQAKELTRDQRPLTIAHFLQQAELTGSNVMTPVVTSRYPVVAQALDWLRERAPAATVAMSGSGSSVYAVFDSMQEAQAVAENRIPDDWQLFVAKGINQSPLLSVRVPVTREGV